MSTTMSSAVQIERTGDPEVMGLVERADPEPGPGELLVEVAAAGVNFIDTYHRSGALPAAVASGAGPGRGRDRDRDRRRNRGFRCR